MIKKTFCVIVLSVSSSIAHASLVTWEIQSAITEVKPDMVGYANVGDVITLRYTFDTETPDAAPNSSEAGRYENAILASDISLNGDYASISSGGYITILNDWSQGEDAYSTSSYGADLINEALPSYNNFGFVGYTFTYKDIDASMFDNTNLTAIPIIEGYDSLRLTLHFRDPPNGSTGLGTAIFADNLISIRQVSAVPIPAAIWLFSIGLISLVGFARYKK